MKKIPRRLRRKERKLNVVLAGGRGGGVQTWSKSSIVASVPRPIIVFLFLYKYTETHRRT